MVDWLIDLCLVYRSGLEYVRIYDSSRHNLHSRLIDWLDHIVNSKSIKKSYSVVVVSVNYYNKSQLLQQE